MNKKTVKLDEVYSNTKKRQIIEFLLSQDVSFERDNDNEMVSNIRFKRDPLTPASSEYRQNPENSNYNLSPMRLRDHHLSNCPIFPAGGQMSVRIPPLLDAQSVTKQKPV